MPKIEISMLLEELNSEEAEKFMKRHPANITVQSTSTEGYNMTTSLTDGSENTTKQLISAVNSENDYEFVTEPTTLDSEDYGDETTTEKPFLLSEFANHLANGMVPARRKATTLPTTPSFIFTTPPDDSFPFMISAAKEFIRRYLSPEQWRKLRILLKTIREVGGSRIDIHRAATTFISKIISKSEMDEITERKKELFRTFNRRYFNNKRKV